MNLGFVNKRGFAQWVQGECSHTAEVELGRVNCPGAKFLVNPKAAKVLRVRL